MNFEKLQSNSPENGPEYLRRLKEWKDMEKYIEKVTENDPEGFDYCIEDLVVGLNLIGLDTQFSCEGHFKGVIEITDGNEHLEKKNSQLTAEWNNPYVGFTFSVYKKREEERRRKEKKIIAGLQLLINEYYEAVEKLPEIRIRINEHKSRYSSHILTISDDDNTEGISGSEDREELKSKAIEIIENERADFLEFGRFLKKKYLETGFHL